MVHMQSYVIYYPSTYSNYGSSQRSILANNDMVKSMLVDDKEGGKNRKQDNKYIKSAEVVSLRLDSQSKEEVTNAQVRISGAIGGDEN